MYHYQIWRLFTQYKNIKRLRHKMLAYFLNKIYHLMHSQARLKKYSEIHMLIYLYFLAFSLPQIFQDPLEISHS